MLPEKTYTLKLCHKDGEYEEMEITNWEDAWCAFEEFARPECMEIYETVVLYQYNWKTKEEKFLSAIEF